MVNKLMNIIFQNEVDKLKKRKLIHSIRIFLDIFSVLLISQWLYSAITSFYRFGEPKVIWVADWIFIAAPIIWVFIMCILIVLSFENKR